MLSERSLRKVCIVSMNKQTFVTDYKKLGFMAVQRDWVGMAGSVFHSLAVANGTTPDEEEAAIEKTVAELKAKYAKPIDD